MISVSIVFVFVDECVHLFTLGRIPLIIELRQRNYTGIKSHVTKSVGPMALSFCSCSPTSNAVGMIDFVSPTLVGGNRLRMTLSPALAGSNTLFYLFRCIETPWLVSLRKETERMLFVVSEILNRSSILLPIIQIIFLLLSMTQIFSLSVKDIF